MVGGLERYFQIVRCFRDEDLRADRQPEFTQIDIETAFLDRDDFLPMMEGLVAEIFRRAKGLELARPFRRLSWDDAIRRYGSDKPDLRFGLELVTAPTCSGAGRSRSSPRPSPRAAPCRPSRCRGPRSRARTWTTWWSAPRARARKGWSGSGGRGRAPEPGRPATWRPCGTGSSTGRGRGGGSRAAGCRPDAARRDGAGAAPRRAGQRLGLIPGEAYELLWVVDFPLVEWNEDERRWDAMHHPFTAPRDQDAGPAWSDPGAARAKAYDSS